MFYQNFSIIYKFKVIVLYELTILIGDDLVGALYKALESTNKIKVKICALEALILVIKKYFFIFRLPSILSKLPRFYRPKSQLRNIFHILHKFEGICSQNCQSHNRKPAIQANSSAMLWGFANSQGKELTGNDELHFIAHTNAHFKCILS